MSLKHNWLLPVLILAILFGAAWPYRDSPAVWLAAKKSRGPLSDVRTWHYQLDRINVEQLALVSADLLVIDYARKKGRIPLTADEVARIKAGPDGKGRYVVAYLSVGEAEEFRYYWKTEWKASPPDWLGEENCAWPEGHRVRFWQAGWKKLNFAAPNSYLNRIINAGFDGAYLDRIDIYETYESSRPEARAEMASFVAELARTAWRQKPGFFIIAQNSESLLNEPQYRSAIDGLGKESLFHGLAATARRNMPGEINASLKLIRQLRRDGKPVFVVEYLLNADHMTASAHEIRSLGFIPTFQTRALDGRDPTAPIVLNSAAGTPERTQKECPPGTSW